MKKLQKIFAASLLLILVVLPSFVFADNHVPPPPTEPGQTAPQATFQPIVPLPGVTSEMSFPQYINQIFRLVISLSSILAVLVIIYGGFEYMTSSAGISKKNGMERIQGAVTGLLLLLSVTLILQIVNPCILEITVLTTQVSESCSPALVSPADAERDRTTREIQNPNDAFANGETDQHGRRRLIPRAGMCTPGDSNPIIPCTGAIPVCKLANGNLFEKRGSCRTAEGEIETVVCPYGCDERRPVISLSPPPNNYEVGSVATMEGRCTPTGTPPGTYKAYCCKTNRTNCVEKPENQSCSTEPGREHVAVCIYSAD